MHILFPSHAAHALFAVEYYVILLFVTDERSAVAQLGDSHGGFAFQVACLSSPSLCDVAHP